MNNEHIKKFHISTGGLKRFWYSLHRRAAKAQTSLRICAASPEPSLPSSMPSQNMNVEEVSYQNLNPRCVSMDV